MSLSTTTKDPMVAELERIAPLLAIPCRFHTANLKEANFDIDKIPAADFPILVHVATMKNRNKFNEANDIERTAKVVCMVLDIAPGTTLDISSAETVTQMNKLRLLTDNLAYHINRSRISVNGGVNEWSADPVYQKFDNNLVGYALDFDWTVDTGSNGFYNFAP